jgi:hypothetical protein
MRRIAAPFPKLLILFVLLQAAFLALSSELAVAVDCTSSAPTVCGSTFANGFTQGQFMSTGAIPPFPIEFDGVGNTAAIVGSGPGGLSASSLANATYGWLQAFSISSNGAAVYMNPMAATADAGKVLNENSLAAHVECRRIGIRPRNCRVTVAVAATVRITLLLSTALERVVVDELAFAVLTNNTIQNHPGAGVFVSEASTGRIGFNSGAETTASPNTVQNNALGVVVSNGSSARVIGNTIQNNAGAGVQVSRDSQADIASNAIDGNGDGIAVEENSLVQLGEDSGTSIFELPNTTTTTNTNFGISCSNGGVADGRLGTLTGASGPTSFDGSCTDGLTP